MPLEKWKKIGDPAVLASKFGKSLLLQKFLNPKTSKEEEYAFIAQKDWSVILPVTKDGNVIVVKQFKQGCNKIITELPAGTADFKEEMPEIVARRELTEETGYLPSSVYYLGSFWIASRSSPTRFHSFLATGCTLASRQKLDENEDIEASLMPFDTWIHNVIHGNIDEPSAVVTTFLSLPLLNMQVTTKISEVT